MIASGQSPVAGYGRFEQYKDRVKYPGDLKPARPVNLKLNGDMLDNYDYDVQGDGTVRVGMVGGDTKAREIATYHNDGTPNMAQRKIVPGRGETWATSIMRAISDAYSKRLAKLIRQSNSSS